MFGLWLSLLWDLSAVTLPEDSSASGGNVSQTWEEQPVLKEPRMLQPPPLRPWLPTVMLMGELCISDGGAPANRLQKGMVTGQNNPSLGSQPKK